MKPALSNSADLHRALGFIDNAVGNGKWAEARKWIRVMVPALESMSADRHDPPEWQELVRCSSELGRVLVREEKRAFTEHMADLSRRLNKTARD